jgi:hypothetical protein
VVRPHCPFHRRGDLARIPLHGPLTVVPPLRHISCSLDPHRSSSWVGVGVAIVTRSRRGWSWPARTAQRRCTHHCWRCVLLAHPRNPKAHHLVWNHVGSTRVASTLPADLLPCLCLPDMWGSHVSACGQEQPRAAQHNRASPVAG